MARAVVALLVACMLPRGGAAEEERPRRLGASAGIAVVQPEGGAPGSGSGFYGDVEYVLVPGSWFTSRAYAGALLTGNDDPEACGEGVAPCEVSAQLGFAGAKVRLLLPLRWVSPFAEAGLGASAGRFVTRSGDAVDSVTTRVTYQVPLALGLSWGERRRWHARFAWLLHPEEHQEQYAVVLGLEFSLRRAGPGAEQDAGQEPAAAEGGAVPAEGGPGPPAEPAPGQPPAEDVVPTRRGKAYVAGWIGIGGGVLNGPAGSGPDGRVEFVPVILVPFPSSIGVGVGVPAGRHLLVGGEWNLTFGFNCQATMSDTYGACDRGVWLQQLLATATVFPFSRAPPGAASRGPFLRAGAGWAFLRSWPADLGTDEPGAAPRPRPEVWSRAGPAALGGVGWALWASRKATVEAALDFSWQWYGDSPPEPEPESSFSAVLHVGFTFHVPGRSGS